MSKVESNQRVIAWGYFALGLMSFLMALFAALAGPDADNNSGGKSGLYYAIFVAVGTIVEPIFGGYSTSAVFIFVGIILFLIWYRKFRNINGVARED